MKVAVARMLKRAQALMDNAAVGMLPCVLPLAEEVAQGQWRALFDHTQPHKVQSLDHDDLFGP